MAEVAAFTGFGSDAMSFLGGLAAENTKTYFDAHRDVYETRVVSPLKTLVVAVGGQLRDRVSDGIEFAPKVGRSMFRINRDLRFSKDKTPYHAHLDLIFWEGASPRSSPGFILRITPDEVIIGSGIFGLKGGQLERWRAAVDDARSGDELVALIDAATVAVPGATLSEPSRNRVPKGYPADHPRADLLRHDGVHLSASVPTPAAIASAQFATWCADRYVKLAGVHRWLVREVGS